MGGTGEPGEEGRELLGEKLGRSSDSKSRADIAVKLRGPEGCRRTRAFSARVSSLERRLKAT